MNAAPIPAYPIVFVDVAVDGSAHVNVAGRHEHFDPAPSAATRRGVTAYAAAVAAELHRPLRMQITEDAGRWLVAVEPTGTVTDLANPDDKQRRPRKQAVTVPAAPLDDDPDQTHLATRRTTAPTATLRFSTGTVAHVTGAALIGRRPSPNDGEHVDLLVSVNDASRELSRTHLRIEWHDGAVWATDRDSSNGTTVERAGYAPVDLTPWQPYQLQHHDLAVIGDVRLSVLLTPAREEVNRA